MTLWFPIFNVWIKIFSKSSKFFDELLDYWKDSGQLKHMPGNPHSDSSEGKMSLQGSMFGRPFAESLF